mgnify:CR=1 FL=1
MAGSPDCQTEFVTHIGMTVDWIGTSYVIGFPAPDAEQSVVECAL